MAQLLCISTKTKKNNNALGDVVGVFPDDHVFSSKEQEMFDIVQVDQSEVDAATPEQRMMFLDPTDDMWKVADEKQHPYSLNYNPQNKTLKHTMTGTALGDADAIIRTERSEKIAKSKE